jgi:hypothetical protein
LRYSKVARKALGRLAFRVQGEVMAQWRASIAEKKENRTKVTRFILLPLYYRINIINILVIKLIQILQMPEKQVFKL